VTVDVTMNVNGSRRALRVEPGDRLVDVLRERLGLLGTKIGCGEGECGACTVMMNGRAVLSCLTLAVQAEGANIETIEGLDGEAAAATATAAVSTDGPATGTAAGATSAATSAPDRLGITGAAPVPVEAARRDAARLHPLQQAFVEEGAIQCGFCTPGMIMAAKGLLDREPDPSEARVRGALAGNLCRCTGYDKPVRAVLRAAAVLREGR
jgi:carbon-monoxide dehydrogenase small subunit